MLCVLYVIAIGLCLGAAGQFIEQVLPAALPRRWIWLVVIAMSVIVPGYARTHHAWSITQVLEDHAASTTVSPALQIAPASMLDRAWWERIEALNPIINRVWLTASALLIAWGLINAIRIAAILISARRSQRNARLPAVVDGVPVVFTEGIGPATVGLLRSRVLVPRWVLGLPGVQRQYVIRHEDEHRRAHDGLLLFVASLTLILMPWNLALWWHLRRLSLAVEMDCDNRVVNALGNPNAYGELLLKIASLGSGGPRFQPALLGSGMLERRLVALLAPTQLRYVQRLLLPVFALGLLAFVLSVPHPVLGHSSHNHAMTASSTNTSKQ